MGSRRPRNKGRMKRAYLKVFSGEMINTGHSVNVFRIKDSPAFHYTQRARGLGLDEEFQAALNRLFGFPVRTDSHEISQERKRVLDKIEELQKSTPGERYVRLPGSRFHAEKLYFSEDHKLWWFREERWFPHVYVRISHTYGSRERALTMRARGTVKWYPPINGAKPNGDQGL